MQFSAIIALAFAAFAAAQNCNSGNMQCCQNMQNMTSLSHEDIMSIAAQGLSLTGSNGQVGSACSPIAEGTSGDVSCTAQAACCSDTSMSGFYAIGCAPLNLS